MQLINYVKVYDNVLTPDECQRCIQYYEENKNVAFHSEQHWNDNYLHFDEINLHDNNRQLNDFIQDRCEDVKTRYFSDCKLDYKPRNYSYEHSRLKKYIANRGKFGTHIDNYDVDSSKRFLALLFYLNDVEVGGETEFTSTFNHTVKAKAGSVLVFPPTFLYPHGGNVATVDKYIISNYMRYA